MNESSGVIDRLREELARLPGIGPKSAERIVHFLLSGDRRHAMNLADALRAVVEKVRRCRECFNHCEGELCPICADKRRDAAILCVVETPRDVTLFERAGGYRGLYHVLGGRLAPLEGMGPDQLTLEPLVKRVRRGGVREVVLATSPTIEGDGTALYIGTLLEGTGVTLSKLARGLPCKADLPESSPVLRKRLSNGARSRDR